KRFEMQYPTAADAMAAGYYLIAPWVMGQGAHYTTPGGMVAAFDPNHPNYLLYDGNTPEAPLVGVAWVVPSGSTPPAGFPGLNDHWHRHHIFCFVGQVIVGEDISDQACASMGGYQVDASGVWLLHAWVLPGWEWNLDVFRAHNPNIMMPMDMGKASQKSV